MLRRCAAVALLCSMLAALNLPAKAFQETPAAEKKDRNDPIERIKDEGMNCSQVMQTLVYLTDVIGPRLTASPGMKRANEWTQDKLSEWGLKNAKLEPWGPFGRGWRLKNFHAQIVEPMTIPLIAYPKAWSPGFKGSLDVVYVDAKNEEELQKYKGKLKGAIVLTATAREVKAQFAPQGTRLTEKELLQLADAPEPRPIVPRQLQRTPEQRAQDMFTEKKYQFFAEEGAALLVDPSRRGDGGTLFVQSASVPQPYTENPFDARRISPWNPQAPQIVPQMVVAIEHYNRMARMIERGQQLKMSVSLEVEFQTDDMMGYNTIAEIPGTDLKDEIVMIGGHLDSWHSGTGATDNGAGVAAAMEAVRIIQALDLKPRRTIRIGLWGGEEQGLLGSRAYVANHFGTFGDGSVAAMLAARMGTDPAPKLNVKPDYEKFSVYFNLDNGTGSIRGVYLQGNEAARPIFRRWLQPFKSMSATTLSIMNTGGTDHLAFDAIGLPGFQFIQDQIEYETRTHHSNQDVFERIQPDDMKQNAVIMAAFLYNAAMMDGKFPRKAN